MRGKWLINETTVETCVLLSHQQVDKYKTIDYTPDGSYMKNVNKHASKFALPVYGDDGNIERYNIFWGRLLIRHASSGKKYLYDILEIKKETGKSCQT